MRDGAHDLLIVGGGIAGAGIARDAALRGLNAALIDHGDFANGTSSRSSKLVHGGLRYLEQAAFRLVREASRERQTLLKIAPHLVRPLPVLFPVYRGGARPLWKIRLGLAVYDFLAGGRNVHHHQMLMPSEISRLEPRLSPRDLEGGGLYYDCRMNDSRLCLENVIDAALAGAAVANYVRLLGLHKSNGRIQGARAQDMETGREFDIRAAVVVNATGPWADHVRLMDDPKTQPLVRKTKGIHILVPRLTRSGAVAVTARSDGRLLFVMPFDERHSLIGTTDTDSPEDPGAPAVQRKDIEYLLTELNEFFPDANISSDNLSGVFAGLRTLLAQAGRPSALSREYKIEESPAGLISLIGGKYTTYRVMAAKIVDRVLRRLGRPNAPCRTDQPLSSAAGGEGDAPHAKPLVLRYGARTCEVLEFIRSKKEWGEEISEGSGVLLGEAGYAAAAEMARKPMDFLRRRTAFCLTHRPDEEVLGKLCRLFQKVMGWDDEKTINETAQARQEWARHHFF